MSNPRYELGFTGLTCAHINLTNSSLLNDCIISMDYFSSLSASSSNRKTALQRTVTVTAKNGSFFLKDFEEGLMGDLSDLFLKALAKLFRDLSE